MALYESVVKWFDAKKGFGFLVHHDGGTDIFIHYSQIATDQRFKTLRTGQRVQYNVEDGPKGIHAINVEALDDDIADAPVEILIENSSLSDQQPDDGL